MTIQLKKFGTILNSRPSGKEAYLAFRPTLLQKPEGEIIVLDFSGVEVLSPSWGDEFITLIVKQYGKESVKFENDSNASVQATLEILEL